ncbi:MAG: hypothetical protein Rubg2KO_34480 [Rubricoccaceae bacterium]
MLIMRVFPLVLLFALLVSACDTADPCEIRGSNPAAATSDVSIDYRGQLENGTVVDEQYCFEANLSTFVEGFQEGVVGMVPGEEKVITVPPEKGYGAVQRGPIPPNSTLIFAVRLRSVE